MTGREAAEMQRQLQLVGKVDGVRRRRALDLTAEEVEALRDLLNYLGPRVLREWKTTAPGMAVLDKLLSQRGGG